jgi:hypothetical protein
MDSLLIEIYWNIVGAILKYCWRVLNVILKKSPRRIISPIFIQLYGGKMANTTAHQITTLKIKKKNS